MNKRFFTACTVTFVLLLVTPVIAIAHCIWSEPPARADANQEVGIDVSYAHPDDPVEEREKTSLSLFVIAPGGDRKELDLEEKATHYKASVRLGEPGQYMLVLERDPNRYRLQEIRDFGKSVTWVGRDGGILHPPVGLPLEIVPLESVPTGTREVENGNRQLTLQILYDGKPVPGAEIEVFRSLTPENPVYEAIGELETTTDGTATLTLDPAYRHVLETGHRVPAREVDGTGFAIREVRFRSTLYIQ